MADEHEIRATSDHTIAIIERLGQIEHDKRGVALGSPEFISMAAEVERLSRLLFRWSGFQMQLATESASAVSRGDIPAEPLAAVQPRPLDRVLALWREAQIRLELAKPGSPEADAAATDIERLREEYHATTEAKLSEDETDGV
ncbi:MAG TPA: hypothetical protein VFJ71_09765 [Candidatus Limnocylindrales bacterium]|nr:hypothetical protein [Candidatus Limnocylindrales bacterium]